MKWDLRVTSPLVCAEMRYRLAGVVACQDQPADQVGNSVRVCLLASGWTEEVFLDGQGGFQLDLDLYPPGVNVIDLELCDSDGMMVGKTTIRVSQETGKDDTPTSCSSAPLTLDPPWSVCQQRVRACLHLAATVALETGRDRDELLQYVHAQERYAEQALASGNPRLYQECLENLKRYAAYLEQMQAEAAQRPPRGWQRPATTEALQTLQMFRDRLAEVWKKVRAQGRSDLEAELSQLAREVQGLSRRAKDDPWGAECQAGKLLDKIAQIDHQLLGAGCLELEPSGESTSSASEASKYPPENQ